VFVLRRLFCFTETSFKDVSSVGEKEMSDNKHGAESEGAKPRDHAHPRHHFLKHAHRDWRVWTVVMLMPALMLVYVTTIDLSHRPGKRPVPSTPEANLP
jgi:hypothetical protein